MITNVEIEGNIDDFIKDSRVLDGGGIEEKKVAFTNRFTTMIPLRRE